MSTPAAQTDYLLLFRGSSWHRDLSPEEIQRTMSTWMAWFDGLVAEGKCKGGHPLAEEGKIVSGRHGAVSDGPFAESKEAVAGFFYLTVSGLEEAVAIAQKCPALPYGMTVEVRPLLPNCGAMEYAQIMDSKAAAA